MRWRFEPMAATDIGAVQIIERQSFDQPWQTAAIAAEISVPNAIHLIAKLPYPDGSTPTAGYLLSRCVLDELHLLRIAVSPQWRCRGLAARLLTHCFDAAFRQGTRVVSLEVRPSNLPALALYRKYGFKPIAERPEYYGRPRESALILTKHLKEAA